MIIVEHDPGADCGSHDREFAEEGRLLLDALAHRAEDFLRRLGADEARAESAGGGSLSWCPLCAVVAVARGERSDLTGRFAEQGAELLRSVRESLREQGAAQSPAGSAEQDRTGENGSDEETATKVQRISVRRVDGNVLREEPAC